MSPTELSEAELDMAGLDMNGTVELPNFRLEAAIQIQPGTTTALLGPNGSGKSTLVSAIAGLLPLSSGYISLDGISLDGISLDGISLDGQIPDKPRSRTWVAPQDRNIGVAFQDGLLFDHMTALGNVAFGLRAKGMPKAQARQQADEMLRWVGLDSDLINRSPAAMSGGQAQSVALARALVGEPRLVLLDEPFSSLDTSVRTRLRRQFSQLLTQTSAGRLLITHDPTDAFLLADYIYILEDGNITQAGTPTQIRRRPTTAYAANLAETNLLAGNALNGLVQLPNVDLHIADHAISGPVLLVIHPRSATLHRSQPSGSPRNVWQATVSAIESRGDITRVELSQPVPLNVDITTAAVLELGITAGSEIWVAIKATEIEVTLA